jgi:hypothetical protein
MKALLWLGLLSSLLLVSVRSNAAQEETAEKSDMKVEALTQEFDAANREYRKLLKEAKTSDERKAARELAPDVDEFAERMLEIAKAEKDQDLAMQGVTWIFTHGSRTDAASGAMKLVNQSLYKHKDIADLLPFISRMGGDENKAELFKKILDENQNEKSRGYACYALAMHFNNDDTEAEAVMYLKQLVNEFGEVKLGDRTLSEIAEPKLFVIENLKIGKVAPDIEGEDIDGVAFKLSEYRGKIVVLDFWGDW